VLGAVHLQFNTEALFPDPFLRFQMARMLQAILFLATIAAAAAESINIHGQVDNDLINTIYTSFGGTWDLSTSGVESFENATISGLLPNADMNSIFANLSMVRTGRHTESSMDVRGPTTYTTPQFDSTTEFMGYSLLTIAQQQWISNQFCNSIGYLTPHF
jgi:hypothetical protein